MNKRCLKKYIHLKALGIIKLDRVAKKATVRVLNHFLKIKPVAEALRITLDVLAEYIALLERHNYQYPRIKNSRNRTNRRRPEGDSP